MARNSEGVMSLAGQFAVPNTIPVSTTINSYISDIVNEITNSLDRNGKGAMLADLEMGGFKVTGMANGTVVTDGVSLGQLQASVYRPAVAVGGTSDAITATYAPPFAAYTPGMLFQFTATGANTIAGVTVNVDGHGDKPLLKYNSQPLLVGDITGAGHVCICTYDGTNALLLNPRDPLQASDVANKETVGEYVGLNDQATTSYTFDLPDKGKLVSGNFNLAQTFTVPSNADKAFPVKSWIDVWQK